MLVVVSVNIKQVVWVCNLYFNDLFFCCLFLEVLQECINELFGLGVIIDVVEGLVLINYYVIDNVDDVQVIFVDGCMVKVEFIGLDWDIDVVLICILVDKFIVLLLGNSDQLCVGDFVVVIGNLFGFSQIVIFGIVLVVGCSGICGLGYQNFIQIDVLINLGNFGGVLVNLQGQLVGINIVSFNLQGSMVGNIGLGLVIFFNLVCDVVDQLVKYGVVVCGIFGIEVQNLILQIVQGLGLIEVCGVLVICVLVGFGVVVVGFKLGDVVVVVNGQCVDSVQVLYNVEGLQLVGSMFMLDLCCDGKVLQFKVVLKEQVCVVMGDIFDLWLGGVIFVDFFEMLCQVGVSGVLVSEVKWGSCVVVFGLQQGDVVIEVMVGEFVDLVSWCVNFQN